MDVINGTEVRDAVALATQDFFLRALAYLGGQDAFARPVNSLLDVHDIIVAGLSISSIKFLQKNIGILRNPVFLKKAVGISLRMTHRKATPNRVLTVTQGGRAWKFAGLMAKATDVFGNQHIAEQWFVEPAVGLDHHCPIDLLSTLPGSQLVEEMLNRIDYGVYC